MPLRPSAIRFRTKLIFPENIFISLENKSSWISTVLNISSQTANRQIETSNTCAEKYDISASANRLTFLYVSSAESANGWRKHCESLMLL